VLGQSTTNRPTVAGNKSGTNTCDPRRLSSFPWNEPVATNSVGQRFYVYAMRRIDTISEREMHPFNIIVPWLSLEREWEIDRWRADVGVHIARKTIGYGGRETLKDIVFTHQIIARDSFFGRLFKDSIGNTPEEDFGVSRMSYATNDVSNWESISRPHSDGEAYTMSRWKRVMQHIDPRYGLRWNYAYTAFAIGRHEDKPIAYGDIRFHYGRLNLGDVRSTDTEMLIAVPLGSRTFLTAGVIQEVNPPDWDRKVSFKVYQKIDGGRIFFGMTVQNTSDHERVRCVMGFEHAW
jgi:hypothetical protein